MSELHCRNNENKTHNTASKRLDIMRLDFFIIKTYLMILSRIEFLVQPCLFIFAIQAIVLVEWVKVTLIPFTGHSCLHRSDDIE